MLFWKNSQLVYVYSFYVTLNTPSDENLEHRSESGSPQVNRSSMTSGQQQGLNKDSMKKVGNRTTQESSQVINGRSTSQQSQGKSLLMGQIIGANKDVTEETLFLGTEIPKYGVVTSHEMELEKVTEHKQCYSIWWGKWKLCLFLIGLKISNSSITGNRKCEFMGRWCVSCSRACQWG